MQMKNARDKYFLGGKVVHPKKSSDILDGF